MTEGNNVERRTVLGVLAAVAAGASTGVGSASSDGGTASNGTTASLQNNEDLEDYANQAGRVSTEQLDRAFEDWNDGEIDIGVLNSAIDAWNSGERVVDYKTQELDDIDEDTTLERAPDGEPVVYQIDSYVGVDARLEIEPGVAIECTEGYGLYVDDGSLVAQGTDDEPILFTGTKPIRGWWDGVYVRSDAIENEMDHCIVEYGGNGYDANLDLSSDQFDSPGEMTLTNCTLRRSGEYGLKLWHSSTSSSLGSHLRDAENNTYSHNRSGPAEVRSENAHTLDRSAEIFGNDNSFIRVSGERMRDEGGTWHNLGVPYRVVERVHTNGYDWEIEAGTTIELEEDARIDVDEDSAVTWVGEPPEETEDEPTDPEWITFTGTQKERGWWDGIRIDSDSANNVLEYVTVEYGGDGEDANIRGRSGAAWDFRNCRIRHSGEYGIQLDGDDVRIRDTVNNTYENNVTPAHARAPNVHGFDSSSAFIDNDNSYVFVRERGGASDSMDIGDFTWENLDVPYRLRVGDIFAIDGGTWTIEPGTTIECEEDVQIGITGSGVVDWRGEAPETEDVPDWITFTATQQDRGWWDGISIRSDSENNALEYVTIEYAGDPDEYGANITATSGGALDFRNCRIRHSEAYGIQLDGDDVRLRDAENNTYENNGTAAFARTANVHGFDSSSAFIDNDNSYVFVRERGGASDYMDIGDFTWDGLDVPYRLRGGDIFAIDGGTWTIEPGAVLEMEQGVEMFTSSDDDVTLNFVGTEDEEIVFTGTEEEPGWWYGIEVASESLANEIKHATIEYGGRPSDFDDPDEEDANVAATGLLDMTDCTIQESGWNGAYVDSAANSEICDENTFQNNENQDCFVDS